MMTFYDKAIHMLKVDEGIRYFAYNDLDGKRHKSPIGKLTIGVGRNLEDVGLFTDEVDYLLKNDINRKVLDVVKIFPDYNNYSEVRRLALLNMCFQLGKAGLEGFKTTVNLIKKEEWSEASQQALKSKWATQAPNRAKRVCLMLRFNLNPYDKILTKYNSDL